MVLLYHYTYLLTICRCGGMVDTLDSKSSGGNLMSVRLRPAVPVLIELKYRLYKGDILVLEAVGTTLHWN
jgi:hypothetical protein